MYPTKSAQLYPIRSPFNCAWLNWLNWKLSWYQRVVQCHSHLGHLVVTWGDNRGTRQGYWRPAQRSWLLKSKGTEVRIRVSKTYMQVVILRKGWSQICGRRAWIQVWEELGKCALVGECGSKHGCNCGRMSPSFPHFKLNGTPARFPSTVPACCNDFERPAASFWSSGIAVMNRFWVGW